jgi:hypothetical protein
MQRDSGPSARGRQRRSSPRWTALLAALRDPADGSPVASLDLDAQTITFEGGNCYPCIDGHPVLLDDTRGLFSVEGVLTDRPTTQDRYYRDKGGLKNMVRQRLLPKLGDPVEQMTRHKRLAASGISGPVLVVGAGDKTTAYQEWFAPRVVICSDVHALFGADLVFDAHRIPFEDATFGLVLAEQVLEHTAQPWLVASEFQRVTCEGGTLHVACPFSFPWHSAPYDYFRFTPTGLRSLFDACALDAIEVTEGAASASATFLSQMAIEQFDKRRARQVALAASRIGFAWMKAIDRRDRPLSSALAGARGLAITMTRDNKTRSERELLDEIEAFVAR